jgi:hypothetical protein
VAHDRLSLTRDGRVAYALKTPYRDGTTHVILEPQDFIARLAVLVPGRQRHDPPPTGARPSGTRP